jgi:hypothetical protein
MGIRLRYSEVIMRAIDDDTEVRVAVLRKLLEWGALPESDVSRMLKQYLLVTDDYRDMAEEGLLDMTFAGDEYVLSCTTLGKLFLEQQQQQSDQSGQP